MKFENFIKTLRRKGKRSFVMQDVMEQCSISHEYARIGLHRLKLKGDIVSPLRGFYVIVPPEDQNFGCIPPEELLPLIARHLKMDYYVALLSAGLFYGATHQKPRMFQVISDKRLPKQLIFGRIGIQFIYKKSLADLPIQNFESATGYLPVSSPELTLIDLFKYYKHSAGISHISTVISELYETLDPKKLLAVAKDLKELKQIQRFLFILEKLDVMDEKKKDNIIKFFTRNLDIGQCVYVPLVPDMLKQAQPRDKKWKIIENSDFESDL